MTFDNVYKDINYSEIYRKANYLLVSSREINIFPFKVKPLIKEQSDIRLCKFSKAFNKYGIPIKDFGSESAIIMELYGAYIIFYNQDEPDYRVRFSILHEFGHFILEHKVGLKSDDPLYHQQEIEANYFAAQLLMPEQILRECQKRGKYLSTDYIVRSFKVSEEAATKRINTLAKITWRSEDEKDCDEIIIHKYSSLINKIAPKNFYDYDFYDEIDRQCERDSWVADSRTRY